MKSFYSRYCQSVTQRDRLNTEEVKAMKDIKNSAGKLVCRVDMSTLLVEIVHKGIVTTVRFLPDNQIEVISSEYKKTA